MRRGVGRKIGLTNRGIWQKYGVHQPVWGTVYDETLTMAAQGKARVPLGGLSHPRIEPEICFKLAAPPPLTDDPARLLGALEWVAHSIEIVQCRNADWKLTLADAAEQNAFHGHLVVGTPLKIFDGLAQKLPAVEVTLRKNGSKVDHGSGANVLDSPLIALAHLVRVLGAAPLAAGE